MTARKLSSRLTECRTSPTFEERWDGQLTRQWSAAFSDSLLDSCTRKHRGSVSGGDAAVPLRLGSKRRRSPWSQWRERSTALGVS